MADRPDSEIATEPADSIQAASASDNGPNSIPEIAVPMLDVHAQHESIHTWKGFFIHIAAIAFGLLLAPALEKTVEYLHQRHLLSEAVGRVAPTFTP